MGSVNTPWWEQGIVLLAHSFFQHWYLLCTGRYWSCSLQTMKERWSQPLRTYDEGGTKAETGGWDKVLRTCWYQSVFFILPACYWLAVFLGFAIKPSFEDGKMQEIDSFTDFSRERTHVWGAKGRAVAEADAGLLEVLAGLLLPYMTQDLPQIKASLTDPPKSTDVVK